MLMKWSFGHVEVGMCIQDCVHIVQDFVRAGPCANRVLCVQDFVQTGLFG